MGTYQYSTSFYALTDKEKLKTLSTDVIAEHFLNLVEYPRLSVIVCEKLYPGKRVPLYESTYLYSAEHSYMYALNNIRGRFPEGEPAIFKNCRYAILYSRNVTGDPLPDSVVKKIINDPFWNYFLDYLEAGVLTTRMSPELELELFKIKDKAFFRTQYIKYLKTLNLT